MTSADPRLPQTFRPRTGQVVSILWTVVALIWAVMALVSGIGPFLRQLPLLAASMVVVYAAFVRPLVMVSAHGVLIRNVFRDFDIPWPALKGIDTRYALTLTTTDGRRVSAWAAPASGRFGAARVTPSDLKALQWDEERDGLLPASAGLRSDSGAAAALVRIHWKELGGRASGPGTVQVRWATSILAALGACVLAGVLVLVL